MTSHTGDWKKKEFAEIKKLAEKYPVIAVADLDGFPASLFQKVRKSLKGRAEIKVSKTRVMKKALNEVEGKKKIAEFVSNSTALIFTEMNPFELYSFLKKNKGNVPAKAGCIAPLDIVIPAGDTGLPPGPALSELKSAGLKVAVQGPTISITKDKLAAKKGEEVSPAVAGILLKLGIRPLKIGLNVVAVYENGEIFKKEVLDIDEEEVFNSFVSAHRKAFNLAINAGYFTEQTINVLVLKAFNEAKALAEEANILTSATVGTVIAKANAQAKAVKALVKDAPAEEKKEEVKEETETASEEKPKEETAADGAEKEKTETKEEETVAAEEPKEEKAEEKESEEEVKEETEPAADEGSKKEKVEEKKETPAEESKKDASEVKEEVNA